MEIKKGFDSSSIKEGLIIPSNEVLFSKGKAPCSVNSMSKEQFNEAGKRIEERLRQLKKEIGYLP